MSNLLVIAVVGLVVPPLMRWLQRGSVRQAVTVSPDGGFTMRPSRRHHLFAAGMAAFSVLFGLVVGYGEYPNWEAGLFIGGAFLVITALYSLTLIRSIRVDGEGIHSRSPIGLSRRLRWGDLSKVTFREWGQTLRLASHENGTVVVPLYMAGLQELEVALLKHAPAGARGTVAFDHMRGYLAAL